jgi:hypothetical protein
MKILVAGLVAAGLGVSSLAQAQPNFANLQPAGLPTVYVTDRSGQETRGKLLTITETSITIDVAGTPKTFASEDVSLIERRGDSLKNGAIAGMVVGAVGGIFSMGLADCPGADRSCPAARVGGFLLSTAFYTAVGVGIDAMIPGRTRIWPRKGQNAGGLVLSASPADHRAFVGWRITR